MIIDPHIPQEMMILDLRERKFERADDWIE